MTRETASPIATVTVGRAHARPTAVAPLLLCTWLALAAGCSHKPSAVVPTNAPRVEALEAGDPTLAVDPKSHDVLMAWVAGDSLGHRVWFSRSSDQGENWSLPVSVSPADEPLRIHPESSPVLVCDDADHVGIAYATSYEVEGRKWPASTLRFVTSTDGGRSWSAPATVNDDTAAGPGNHSFFGVTRAVTGKLYAAWLDSRPGADSLPANEAEGHDASIHLARSDDFGRTWGKNVAQWSHVCPCCRAGIAVDMTGTPYVSFRKHFDGQVRDAVVARTGYPPVRMANDGWVQGGCPHSGPALVMSLDGTLRMAWFTGSEGRAGVYFRETLADELDSLGTVVPVLVSEKLPTVHVAVAEAGMSGTLIACDADSTGGRGLTLARVEPSGRRLVERFALPGAQGVDHPRLAVAHDSKIAYVAWTTQSRDHRTIRLARWTVGR